MNGNIPESLRNKFIKYYDEEAKGFTPGDIVHALRQENAASTRALLRIIAELEERLDKMEDANRMLQ